VAKEKGSGGTETTLRLSGIVGVAEGMLAPVLLMVGAAFLFRDYGWWVSSVWLIAISALLGNTVAERYRLPSAVSMLPVGVVLVLLPTYYGVRVEAALRLFPVAAFGGWMVLDGVQAYRHGGAGTGTEAVPLLVSGRVRKATSLLRAMSRVHDSLQEEPAGVSVLSDRLGIERRRVEVAVSELEAAGQVRYENGRYYAEDRVLGGVSVRVPWLLGWVPRRLVRPAYPRRY
jgi:hypothetical protein